MRWVDIDPKIQERLEDVIMPWKGTPYMTGQQICGVGVDCVRFVCAVLDDLYGMRRQGVEHMPYDTCLHNPEGARRVMKKVLSRYDHETLNTFRSVEPGDILMVGVNGAPGHAMIIGKRNQLWHQSGKSVVMTSAIFPVWKPVKLCRPKNKDLWICHS